MSRAQLSLQVNRPAEWQDGRGNRRDEAADAELLSRILAIINDMPGYGYRRVWALLRRQSRNDGSPPVNAKRVYRIMSANRLLLLHDKPQRPKREHNGKIAVAQSDLRWCSDGFEFRCDDGNKSRIRFIVKSGSHVRHDTPARACPPRGSLSGNVNPPINAHCP